MEHDTAIEGEVVSEALAVHDMALTVARAPQIVLDEARKAANALADVLNGKKKKVTFNGEQYLEFEDWQTLGRFYGITARVDTTAFVQYDEVKGFEAHASAILIATGAVISAADAMCLNDEANWSTKPRYEYVNNQRHKVSDEPVPLFQLRSMAQTRACAKALRNVLAWVVVLAGYRPTPAEEMDGTDNGHGSVEAANEVAQRKIAESKKVTKAQESITVSPWENGTVALSGHGLTILAANVEGGISSFATWLGEAKLWITPIEGLSKVEGLAKFHSVEMIRKDFPVEEESSNGHTPTPEPVGPVISAIAKKTKKDGNPYLSVRWGESFFSCFDEKLFTYLEKGKGMSAGLLLSTKNDKGYQNIVGIGYIGRQNFHQNQPML